ncbi:melanoma-associated antigen 10-like [Phodopus roborovskii]|uniref:melanoma-associated antigen 10-like n=1 Tax=Phodopus roborovskii TaxID=109678 RepID=UPI0021E44A09|nr:melanoma-associated antigen 10-like [Phodopus roborovskii]
MPPYRKRPRLNFEEELLESNKTQELLASEDHSNEEEDKNKESKEEDIVVVKDEKDMIIMVEDEEEVIVVEDDKEDNVMVAEDEEEVLEVEGQDEVVVVEDEDDDVTFVERKDKEEIVVVEDDDEGSIPSTFSMIQGTPGKEEGHTSHMVIDSKSLWEKFQNKNVTDLVNLMILKYRMKEPITKAEMLEVVTDKDKKQFPMIFKEASNCLDIIFGIEVKENDLVSHSFVLRNSLNLTYEDDNQRKPTNGFLILILGVVFMEENCASEESIWKFLNIMGVYDGEEHFIYGDPTKLLTGTFIEQNYLEYHQVPNCDPPRYVFQWGPRAYAETTKMKVLEFLAKVTGRDPISFSLWYEEAFRDDAEQRSNRRVSKSSATQKPISQNESALIAAQSEESMAESVSEENRHN